MASIFDGVALPSTWSRLRPALHHALDSLWDDLGLLDRVRPECWVTLQFGRIAINAHGWDRLSCCVLEAAPDPSLSGPPARGLQRLPGWWERRRVRRIARRFGNRLQSLENRADARVDRVSEIRPYDLETQALARGPLDERDWSSLLVLWLMRRLHAEPGGVDEARVRQALRVEQAYISELGTRLVNDGVLHKRGDVAYLTVEERIQAVHEASSFWMKLVKERALRAAAFAEIDVPERFWGTPRVDPGTAPWPL